MVAATTKHQTADDKQLWWSARQVEEKLQKTPAQRRFMMRRGLLTAIWPYGRGKGKRPEFDPEEVRLIARGNWAELRTYQEKMGRTKRRK